MKSFALLCVLCLSIAPLSAKEIGGVTLPDTLESGGESLLLNGAGLRKKLFIKVYAGGLYLKAKNKTASAIIDADEAMTVRMHFIYKNVSSEKLTGAWNDGFAHAADKAALKDQIAAFNALFSKDAKKGDVYDIHYVPGEGIHVTINGTKKGTVKGNLAFKKAVFAIWLGTKPADDGLKSGMLGG